jgi:hypothetical protein
MRKPYRERAEARERETFGKMRIFGKFLLYFFLFEVACVLFLVWSMLWDGWLALLVFALSMLLPLLLGINAGICAAAMSKTRNIEREAMELKKVFFKQAGKERTS